MQFFPTTAPRPNVHAGIKHRPFTDFRRRLDVRFWMNSLMRVFAKAVKDHDHLGKRVIGIFRAQQRHAIRFCVGPDAHCRRFCGIELGNVFGIRQEGELPARRLF